MSTARRRRDAEETKTLILDAAERLMKREGYSVVNTRSAALEAGVKPNLVHYHFDTTENLLFASYRRSAARSEALLREALQSCSPLHAIWNYNCDRDRTVLATQFMALAAERKPIAEEMARNVEKFRALQATAIERALSTAPSEIRLPPDVVALLIAALGRALVMETSIGVTCGHEGLRDALDVLLQRIEPADM